MGNTVTVRFTGSLDSCENKYHQREDREIRCTKCGHKYFRQEKWANEERYTCLECYKMVFGWSFLCGNIAYHGYEVTSAADSATE